MIPTTVKCQTLGEVLSLDPGLRLGIGGEGVIYGLARRPELAAKIYLPEKMNAERVSKLEAMLANAPDDPPKRTKGHASIAWPVELLCSVNGHQQVVGFLMPRLQKPHLISDFYDVSTRHSKFPLFTYKHLYYTALNLASAVSAIHQKGYVIGDVNDRNILVTDEALVSIVDTDSFQVTDHASGRVYRCTVGTDMFTPPEMYSQNLEEVDRLPEQDMFGIAVLFFQLLMEGILPFAGVYRGPGELTYNEALLKGYFPYGGNSVMDPPRAAPPFEMLPPRIQDLFRQCFIDGHADPQRRPDALTWYQTFKECEQSLRVCARNTQHHYFSHCASCPWCERAESFKKDFEASGFLDWDPFPPPQRAQEFKGYDYTTGQTSAAPSWSVSSGSTPTPGAAPAATPPPPPSVPPAPPSSFTASAPTVIFGQPVTLHWVIPQAQSVQITGQSGRRVFAGNSSAGSVTVYPAKTQTYHINASGTGVRLPNPVAVSVTQAPQPVTLGPVRLELHHPIPLNAAQVGLRHARPLNRMSVRLSSPSRLKRYLPLNSYMKLRRVLVN